MRASMFGELRLTKEGAGDVADSALTILRFPSGFIAHAPSLSVHQSGGRICVAGGRPRFERGGAASLGVNDAAAWLASFEKHGADAPAHVGGSFFVVVVEPARQAITLAVDRFSTLPLCYAATADGIGFSDRADEVPGSGRSLSPQAIFDYLFFHVIPAPTTIFEGVQRLLPGHVLEWVKGEVRCVPYWRPAFVEQADASLEACEAEFLGHVEDAVRRESSDPHTGAFLSGGTDSSTVAGMLAKIRGGPVKAYSIGFEVDGYDEMHYARTAARHFGLEHREYYVTPADIAEGLTDVARHFDQPFGNSSVLPASVCARVAREDGCTKLLAGDGGDELFGGNVRYAKQRIFDWYTRVPQVLRTSALEPLAERPFASRVPLVKKVQSYVSQARIPMPDRMLTYNMLLRIGVGEIFTRDYLAAIDVEHPVEAQRITWRSVQGTSFVNQMLAFDWKHTLADNDLPKVVNATQLAGIDVAFPLLSDELLELSAKLPSDWKLKGLSLRWFFKHALREFLPKEILEKKKHGFGMPFGVWVNQDVRLRSLAEGALQSFAGRGVVQPGFVDRLFTRNVPEHPGYFGELVYILVVLELWMQRCAPDWRWSA